MLELPFTTGQFLDVFRSYNQAVWPAQVVAYALGLLAAGLAWRRPRRTGRVVAGILAAFWAWMGAVYHIGFFSAVNPAAYLFGTLFVLQGALFLLAGRKNGSLTFGFRSDAYGIVGGLLILYAMLAYPALGAALGHGYPAAPVFGVAPCPTTIFTFGVLLWTVGRVPGWLLVIPGLWSVIGFTAALRLGVLEDLGLLVAGVAAIAMLLARNRRVRQEPARVAA